VLLRNKVAVVLGASEEGGTGWVVAEALAAEGAQVVVAARRQKPLEALAAKIGGVAISCDATMQKDVAALTRTVSERLGPIDLAVNSSFVPMIGSIAELPDADLERSIAINFTAQVRFVREMAAAMRDGGAITLFSTFAAVQPVHARFAYGCAKAATDALVRYAAVEYGARGIRVNSILPGPIRTAAAAHIYDQPDIQAAFAKEIPLRRVGTPEDFGRAVIALALADYVTGVNLPVSGGIHLARTPRPDEVAAVAGVMKKQ